MPKVTVATFNCENLFARFKFKDNVDPKKATEDGFSVDMTKFDILNEVEKKLTGKAIRKANADVIALQEVDNLEVLRRFRSEMLKGMEYDHAMLIDGNDPRHIDVAVLSRHPIVRARSYHHVRSGNSFVFSRDCLEADIKAGNQILTLFVNHFKSMMGGRAQTKARRQKQAAEVKKIVTDRFGKTNTGSAAWIIAGDLNDFIDGKEGIAGVTSWNQVENVLDRLPSDERWTHFFEREDEYRQLDYLLVSKGLSGASPGKPVLVRDGLCLNADRYTGPRFPGIGPSSPAASDHCPLIFSVNL
jgi:endonuclease/exonuclease/phosphatase family metal-dependent hydrolase